MGIGMKVKVWGAWMLMSICLAWGWRAFRQRELNRGFDVFWGRPMTSADLRCVLEELPTREMQKSPVKTFPADRRATIVKDFEPRQEPPVEPFNEHKREAPIDVNGLDSAGWDALPWIGAWTARRIVRYRESLGGFISLDQIQSVYHIHDSAVAMVTRRGFINFSQVQTICIDTASWATMVRHPLIDKDLARIIERYRTQHEIGRVEDLLGSRAISDSVLLVVRPYLSICQTSGEGF